MEKFHGEGFHLTLTNFWIQVVDLSLAKSGNNPAPMDFVTFFGKAPELQNENLPLDYYKKEVLYSKEAEKSIVSPDKKKLVLLSAQFLIVWKRKKKKNLKIKQSSNREARAS